MSLQFSDTSTYKGIVQVAERELGLDRGTISGNTAKLKDFTVDVNLAWDDYLSIALPASGEWQYDDSNHGDYPIIKTNLVDGQRSYIFTTDENSNLILDVYKVLILPSATATLYEEIYPIDQQTRDHAPDITSENTAEGIPYRYDKTANGIFLDPPSSYNATNGLKLLVNREPSYFAYTDTTKKPGCPGIHHEYFAIKAAYAQARRKGLASQNWLLAEIRKYEGDEERRITGKIAEYFGRRNKDVVKVLTPKLKSYV